MRRVVVTGMGCVSPVGNSPEEAWTSIKNGVSGIEKITLFDTSDCPVKIAGEVKGFSVSDYGIEKSRGRKMARFAKFACASAVEAVSSSGFSRDGLKGEKVSVYVGCCLGGSDAVEEAYKKLLAENAGPSRVPPLATPLMISCSAAASVSMLLGITGPSKVINTACASGTDAIGEAFNSIRSGFSDVAIAGGTEASIDLLNLSCYYQLSALTGSFNDKPHEASRPFDSRRDGFVASEGACMLFLEELEHAKRRNANILAEIAGYGATCDAYHITSPREDGSVSALALENAILDAGIDASRIDYYNAHGTSTLVNDLAETNMIKKVFGSNAGNVCISSTKSMTGHMIGAAGAIETMFCIQALNEDFIPPTINLSSPDVSGGCDLDYTPNVGRKKILNYAATGSFGFGGHNACLVIKKI